MNIYVASSWRNEYQPAVVSALRRMGHTVYDFRNPAPGNRGFSWSEIEPRWQEWTLPQYLNALDHDLAVDGFTTDFDAMDWADTCVLVLPCGRSAHLEAGWFVGQCKRLVILSVGMLEPELMYKMADAVCGGDTVGVAVVELRKVIDRLED